MDLRDEQLQKQKFHGRLQSSADPLEKARHLRLTEPYHRPRYGQRVSIFSRLKDSWRCVRSRPGLCIEGSPPDLIGPNRISSGLAQSERRKIVSVVSAFSRRFFVAQFSLFSLDVGRPCASAFISLLNDSATQAGRTLSFTAHIKTMKDDAVQRWKTG